MATNLIRAFAAAIGLTSVFGVEAGPPSKNDPSAKPGQIIIRQSTIGGRVIIQGSGGEAPSVIIDPTAQVRGGGYYVDKFGRTTVITPRPGILGSREDYYSQPESSVPSLPPYCVNPLRLPSVTQRPSVNNGLIMTNRICPAGTVDTRVQANTEKAHETASDKEEIVPALEVGRVPYAVFPTTVSDVFCAVSGDVVVGNVNASCQTYPIGTYKVPNPYGYNQGFSDKTTIYCKDKYQINAATKSYLQFQNIPAELRTPTACLVFRFV
jgi:hypothetical protein